MIQNKKFWLIIFFFIFVPILYLINFCIVKGKYFFWDYNCSPMELYLTSSISLIFSLFVLQSNRKELNPSKFWYTVSVTFACLSALHLLFLYSVSNIGF